MDEILGSVQISETRFLHLGTLSRSSLAHCGSIDLGTDGYFLFEASDDLDSKGITILGKASSLEAAFRLMEIWESRNHLMDNGQPEAIAA